MGLFSTAIILTFFHSLWQSLLISGFYQLDQLTDRRQSPNTKTNKLLLLLSLQLIVSMFTFSYFAISFQQGHTISFLLITQSTSIGNLLGTISPYLCGLYFTILLTKTLFTWIGWKNMKEGIMTGLSKADIDIKLFTLQKSYELGIKKKINIWYSDKIGSPVTFGFLKPVILLPVALVSRLSIQETEALIVHELTHIKNNDSLFNHLVVFCEHVFFFNPFMISICKQIRWQRELRCDLQVLHYNYDEIVYAESLYKAAIPATSVNKGMWLAAVSSRFSLLKRIEFFTRHQSINIRQSGLQKAKFTVSFVFLCLMLSSTALLNLSGHHNSFSKKHTDTSVKKRINISMMPSVPSNVISTPPAATQKNIKAGFSIEHSKLPATHNSVQNDININLLQPDENVSFISNKSETYENDKQIIVKEENPSTGEIITKSYHLVKHNGVWESNLIWVISEKPVEDRQEKETGTLPVQ